RTRSRVSRPSLRPPAIEVSKDGPYRITGGIPFTDDQNRSEPRNQGASLEHYSLCRCGHSQNKPFCSGMHWYGIRSTNAVLDSEFGSFECLEALRRRVLADGSGPGLGR